MRRFRVHLIALLTLAACTSAATSPDAPAATASSLEPASDAAIVFVRSPDFESPGAVFSVAADGSDEREISEVWAEGAFVAPDGARFAEPVQGDDGRITTAVFDGDGANRTVLSIPDPTLQLGVGAWSPDGEFLLLEGWDDTDDTRDGIYLRAPYEDSDLTRVTDPGDGHDFPGPFSPDGSSILFIRSGGPPDEADLWVTTVDAPQPVQVTDSPALYEGYAWLP